MCIGCMLCAMEGGLYICLPSESHGPNLLDETFEWLHSETCWLSLEVSLEIDKPRAKR